jgi:hypothetical protein
MDTKTILSVANGALTLLFLLVLYWSFRAKSFLQGISRAAAGIIALGLNGASPPANGESFFGFLMPSPDGPFFVNGSDA